MAIPSDARPAGRYADYALLSVLSGESTRNPMLSSANCGWFFHGGKILRN